MMSLTDILRYVVLPLLTLASLVGMVYVAILLLGSEKPFAAVPCILLAGVIGFFSYLDARKIYTKLIS
jgi:hypothetical protein